ncbi:MAG TPA: N-acyl homoserine lactonase family protein [Burkholderiales bacterium]|nr:N-acyl homoserine lactonase family protein [Burkholderiales bacterium]
MSEATYEIHAIKYGQLMRRSPDNFIGGDEHNVEMPLNYYVWTISNAERTIVVDTGFNEAMAKKRNRTITKPVAEGLKAMGHDVGKIKDVVVTHMHYDHAGNIPLFPNARYHLQDKEMDYATGRCMCHGIMNHGYEADDVVHLVRCVFAQRVQFHDGSSEIAPGVELHHIGGHTKGMQAVRVRTKRGWVVLASDSSHFYAHMEQDRAFPIVYNVSDMMEGFNTLRRLATSRQHIIPGHDPLVMARYPIAKPGMEDWIARLDVEPKE